MKWSVVTFALLSGLITFLLLHDVHLLHKEYSSQDEQKRPYETIRQLFDVCSVSQKPEVMQESHKRAQKFLKEAEIIGRSKNIKQYFHQIPTEGLRQVSAEEKAFPLAFVHLIHDQVGIFELFLAVMFRPQNYHCIHVDKKASKLTKVATQGIVRNYQVQFNTSHVFLSSSSIDVYWAHITVVDAELICLNDLLRFPDWQYVLTTAGTELPILPHRALRAELETVKDKDIFVSEPFPYRHYERFNETHELIRIGTGDHDLRIDLKGNGRLKSPPPLGIHMFKGYKNVALTRRTVDHVANHPASKAFRDWLSDSLIPDESYYATLGRINYSSYHNNSKAVVMNETMDTLQGSCTRFSIWKHYNSCSGEVIRDVCNFGFGDLLDVWNSDCWTANKFSLKVDANAVICHVKHLMELNKYH